MILLADNDILLKLAACDLLDHLPALLGVERAHIFVLPTAVHKIRDMKGRHRYEAQYSIDGIDRALAFITTVEMLDASQIHGNAEFIRLTAVSDIDAGEALLLGAAHYVDDPLLVTGDKRCLRALAAAETADATRACLSERCLCFEALLLELIDMLSFAYVCERVAPAVACDGMLKLAFSNRADTSEAQACDGLRSALDALRRETGTLLR